MSCVTGMMERERQVMKKLKEVVDKQRDEIRAKDRELTLRNEDVEALQQQQSRLMRINQELRQRLWVLEAQGRKLIQQKVELEAQDQERQQELQTLHRELQRLQGRNQNDHSRRPERGTEEEPESLRPPSPAQDLASELQARGLQVQEPLLLSPMVLSSPRGEDEEELPVCCLCVHQEALSEDAISTDQKDSNRPRFTLQELRDVLHERNELKAKVFMLQEELAYYRSEDQDEEAIQPLSEPSQNSRPSSRSGFQPESGIKRLIFTAVMPMVAAGLIPDDPTLQPIRRLMSLVRTSALCVGSLFSFFSRDKSGGRRFAAAADGSNPWTQKNELYTEQAQEALQHM
ncbi:hypothetical protein DNTS_032819 [Danionella cerebrum]|uniref:RH2 domain-containing protein n=1 Tax=Danionella cerebrum TaxID=2873325 RepID=A0A553QW66_9TELE|nr:hypothetical protein DNTS_032819 [Danionella translucida]